MRRGIVVRCRKIASIQQDAESNEHGQIFGPFNILKGDMSVIGFRLQFLNDDFHA